MVLISDDPSLPQVIRGLVADIQGMKVAHIEGYDEACQEVAAKKIALVLTHVDPAGSVAGLTRLLSMIAATGQRVPVLALGDDYHADQALMLLRLGVAEYFSRPLDLGRLGWLIDVLTLAKRRITPQHAHAAWCHSLFLVPEEGWMGHLMEQVRLIAPQETTVLLGGETGTGKTRLAGEIHRISPRRNRPFLTVNCGALCASLIETEMFGHSKGAFTGADADHTGKFADVGSGTLFLDEIDSLPHTLQGKLLRAVEERVFEPVGSNKTQSLQARLIVASNRPLDREVASGRFRADLYYRLNVVKLNLPPLRDRPDEVPILAQNFLAEFARRAQRPEPSIAPEAMRLLVAHGWPGNVRELRNAMERAIALSSSPVIGIQDLPEGFANADSITWPKPTSLPPVATLADATEQAERKRIAEAMKRNGYNRLQTAAELGICRMTLYNKLHKLGLMGST
jgi:two-component system response regulator HydG